MTTQQQLSVNVDIYGQQYKLRGHSSPEYMKMVAQTIDESMVKLAKSYPVLDTHKLAVLTAVQISEEVFRLRKENTRLEGEEERLKLTVLQVEEMQQKLLEAQKTLDSYKYQAAIQIDEIKLQYEQQYAKKDQQHTMVLAEQKADYDKKVGLLEQSQGAEIERLKVSYEETINALQAQLDSIINTHSQELARLVEESEQDKKLAIVQLKSKFETELAKQRVDFESLAKKYEDFKINAEQTETKLRQTLNETAVSSQQQVAGLEQEVSTLTSQLTELNEMKETERNSFELRLMQADAQLVQALELEQRLNHTIEQLEKANTDFQQQYGEEKGEYEAQLLLLEEAKSELTGQIAIVEQELTQLKAESEKRLSGLYTQLEETEGYLTKSQEQTEQYKEKVLKLEEQISVLQKKFDEQEQLIKLADDTLIEQTLKAKEDLSQFEQTYRSLQIELEQQRSAKLELENHQQSMQVQLAEQKSVFEQQLSEYKQLAEEKHKKQYEEIEALQQELEKTRQDKVLSEQANKQMYDELLVELEQINLQKEEKERINVQAFRELEQELELQLELKSQEVHQLEHQLSETNTEQELTVLLVQELEEEVQSFKTKLTDSQVNAEKREQELAEQVAQLQALVDEKNSEHHVAYELQAQLMLAHKKLSEVEAQRDTLATQHRAALEKSEELLQYLELSAAKDRLAENKYLALSEEYEQLKQELSQWEMTEQELRDNLSQTSSELQQLQDRLSQYETQLSTLEAAATSAYEDNQQAEVVLRLEEQLEKLQHEHNKLQSEYSKLQTEYNEWIELID